MAAKITGAGQSKSWKAHKTRVRSIFTEFRDAQKSLIGDMDISGVDLSPPHEAVLTDQRLYHYFAGWLVKVYRIPEGRRGAGEHLAPNSAVNYLSSFINEVKALFFSSSRVETVRFLQCLDANSNSKAARWFENLRRQTKRQLMELIVDTDKEMDQSAPYIYQHEIERLLKAYTSEQALEAAAAERRLCLLTTWQLVGRGGEASHISMRDLGIDTYFGGVVVRLYQNKVVSF